MAGWERLPERSSPGPPTTIRRSGTTGMPSTGVAPLTWHST